MLQYFMHNVNLLQTYILLNFIKILMCTTQCKYIHIQDILQFLPFEHTKYFNKYKRLDNLYVANYLRLYLLKGQHHMHTILDIQNICCHFYIQYIIEYRISTQAKFGTGKNGEQTNCKLFTSQIFTDTPKMYLRYICTDCSLFAKIPPTKNFLCTA